MMAMRLAVAAGAPGVATDGDEAGEPGGAAESGVRMGFKKGPCLPARVPGRAEIRDYSRYFLTRRTPGRAPHSHRHVGRQASMMTSPLRSLAVGLSASTFSMVPRKRTGGFIMAPTGTSAWAKILPVAARASRPVAIFSNLRGRFQVWGVGRRKWRMTICVIASARQAKREVAKSFDTGLPENLLCWHAAAALKMPRNAL